jgi:hypothetical protein
MSSESPWDLVSSELSEAVVVEESSLVVVVSGGVICDVEEESVDEAV